MASTASTDPALDSCTDAATPTEAPAPRWLELSAQTLLLAVAVAVMVNSLSLGLVVPLGPGAGFFPFFLSIGLAVLTGAWFFQAHREHRDSTRTAPPAQQHSDPRAAEQRRHIANVLISLIVLAVLMIWLGYQIPMFCFIVFHLRILAHRRWHTTLIIALAGSVGVFHIFSDLLSVALPLSSIQFLAAMGF